MKNIETISFKDELEKSYLEYGLAVIYDRAIPDIRDGLKPIHRRIIYTMYELGLKPNSPYKKSARIIGDVMGKYHPHGDSAIYESLVRMAQPFTMNIPYVDGQGNFGSIDGDSAAAYRYTEARLTKFGYRLLKDIEKNIVDKKPNYDNTIEEPTLLPSPLPTILINAISGIAVGLSTNIPPHNINNVCDATIAYIKNSDIDIDELIDIIEGPDFCSGGVIYGRDGLRDIYIKGSGSITLGAKYKIDEENSKITIYELPYNVGVNDIMVEINSLINEKKIEGIKDIKDERGIGVDISIVIDVKKGYNLRVLMNKLLKNSNLLIKRGYNLICLTEDGVKHVNLKDIIEEWFNFRKETIIRTFIYDKNRLERKLSILKGYVKVVNNIESVISIIKSGVDVKDRLKKLLDIYSDSVIQSILDMRLQKISKLEKDKTEQDISNIESELRYIGDTLSSSAKLNQYIIDELIQLKRDFGYERKTEIESEDITFNEEQFIDNKDVFILYTKNGYIAVKDSTQFREQRRGGVGKKILKLEDDIVKDIIKSRLLDNIYMFSNRGRIFKEKVFKLPSKPRYLNNFLNIDEDEKIVNVINLKESDRYLVFILENGNVIIKDRESIDSGRVKRVIGDGRVVKVLTTDSLDRELILLTSDNRIARIRLNNFRVVKNSNAKGIKSVYLDSGQYIKTALIVDIVDSILSVTTDGYVVKLDVDKIRLLKNRNGKGVQFMKGREVVDIVPVDDEDRFMIVTKKGYSIILDSDKVREVKSRFAKGVKAIKLEEGDSVVELIKIENI